LGVTVQIPFELQFDSPDTFTFGNEATLRVSDGVKTSGAVSLKPESTHVRILRNGDTVVGNNGVGPLISHADGTLVSSSKPAAVGEILTMYAAGLGRTDANAKTGEASPPVPAAFRMPLIFDYRPNATASAAALTAGQSGSTIQTNSLFAALAPGYVGLYQVNFQVPPPPGPISACGNGVNSNLTVNLVGTVGSAAAPDSFDGAGICVAAD
jgi:uncharacterized protein (TIGR03437 family)